ncbi:hypothetical protein ACH5RR_041300 [Cinchona calisaya]|uniref:Uncharacterized protein n=1 Tax=Cinchona calisaya TaxID=153742 RepID=A0ABD2XU00_9GENT
MRFTTLQLNPMSPLPSRSLITPSTSLPQEFFVSLKPSSPTAPPPASPKSNTTQTVVGDLWIHPTAAIRNHPRSPYATSKYFSVFQDLIFEGFLSPNSKSLSNETLIGDDVITLRNIGVANSIRISKKSYQPLVRYSAASRKTIR